MLGQNAGENFLDSVSTYVQRRNMSLNLVTQSMNPAHMLEPCVELGERLLVDAQKIPTQDDTDDGVSRMENARKVGRRRANREGGLCAYSTENMVYAYTP